MQYSFSKDGFSSITHEFPGRNVDFTLKHRLVMEPHDHWRIMHTVARGARKNRLYFEMRPEVQSWLNECVGEVIRQRNFVKHSFRPYCDWLPSVPDWLDRDIQEGRENTYGKIDFYTEADAAAFKLTWG